MQKYYNILELNKIIDRLKEEVVLEVNYQKLDNEEFELFSDLEIVENMLNEVDEGTVIIERLGSLPFHFKKNILPSLIKTTKYGILTIEEVMEIGKFLDTIRDLIIFKDSLSAYNIDASLFNNYVIGLVYPKNLNLRIKEIVNQFGEILDSASIELKNIRRSIKDTEKNISSKLNEIVAKNSSKLTQTIVTIRNDRYVIPVKNDFKNAIKGITHDQSSSGETIYIEPIIICELNNKLNNLKEEEKKEINRILKEVSELISLEYYTLCESYRILTILDMIFAKSRLSLLLKGTKPRVNKKGIVEIYNCYHPLLNVPNIVSNNIIIGKEYQGIIITGPNTGGKTVLLKTIGLLSLMIKMGILIPCSPESNIMIFDDVYADIGDEQSIDQNLSTFSSHLKNVIEIMNMVNENSLVLLDELGSGTDPQEGAALAISIFDYLISKHSLVISTSHYSELKVHAYEATNIINASVEFDINTLKPTYKLLIGIPGESNALKISKILGLPDEIITKAEGYADQSNNEINLTLEKLINQSNLLEKKLNELKHKEVQLNNKLEEIDKLKVETIKEKNRILEEASNEASKIIENSLKKIESILEELEELKLREIKQHEIANVKHEIKELKDSTIVEEEYIPTKTEIVAGDNVYVSSYKANGKVLKVNKGKYFIQIGNATVTVKKDEIKLTNEDIKDPVIVRNNKSPIIPKKTVKATLDLRGLRYEDAEGMIDDYIYDAIYAGLHQVSIIHGFGTGVIRELVRNKLKNNHNVTEFRYGGQNEGGQGVTVVTLKS